MRALVVDYTQLWQYEARRQSEMVARIIQNAVETALCPFRPGIVTTCFSERYNALEGYRVQVSADNLVDDDLIFYPDFNQMRKFSYTEQVAYYIAEKAHEHYSNLEKPSIADNIILGAD